MYNLAAVNNENICLISHDLSLHEHPFKLKPTTTSVLSK